MSSKGQILIGYDGSDAARQAIREAAELFDSRPALVVTVWEAGLAYLAAAMPAADMGGLPAAASVGFEEADEIDDAAHAHARRVAQEGAELAKSFGLSAEALAAAEYEGDEAEAILRVARKRNVAAIVVGSRGLTGLRARLEGSTSQAVLKHARCPVVVVHHDRDN
jgi:nucleotide-binding universal stress UspA family protein